jgi:hypothetical protein
MPFANACVDVSRAFLPFGDKPKIGDVFYVGSREALGQPGGAITIDVTLANPLADLPPGTPRTPPPSLDLQLKWEVWDGATWALLGATTPNGAVGGGTLVDDGKAFTKSKSVKFTLPQSLARATVNGVESNWIRVQIVAGNYGLDATFVPDPPSPGGFRLHASTLAPPLVSAFALSYAATLPPVAPDAVVAFNSAQFRT